MKIILTVIIVSALWTVCGCTQQAAEKPKAGEKASIEARAEATRKEMDAAAKTFQNRDYFKKHEPAPTPAPSTNKVPESNKKL